MNQKHLLCFYASNIVKSNKGSINHVHALSLLVDITLEIYTVQTIFVWSTKHFNYLGRSTILSYVNIENKISFTFYNKVKSVSLFILK